MFNGWIYMIMNGALVITLAVVIVHYYKPKKREDLELAEQPKYQMLEDDDED